jgi:hypothetical protein
MPLGATSPNSPSNPRAGGGALPHQERPYAVKRQQRLALLRLDGHEAHGRSTDGLADGLSIGRVGLVPLDVRLCILRWDQSRVVTEGDQFPRPVMRARAGLHRYDTRCEPPEEREQVLPPQPALQHRAAFGVDAVDLKHGLGEIKADGGDGHGELPIGCKTALHSSNIAAEAVHAIKWQLQHRYMQIEGMAELDAPAEANQSLIAEADPA